MSERADRREAARTGTDRAAILLLTLGENEAAQVLKHMGAEEVQRIGSAMAKLANVSREHLHVPVDGTVELVLATHHATLEPGYVVLPPLAGALVR